MPRTFYINGETMVTTTGPAGSLIAGGSQLGLASEPIRVDLHINSEPLIVDAYGKGNPVDEQVFGGTATITMNLIHFNPTTLAECVRLSFPPSTVEGQQGRAGWRRGSAFPLLAAGNNLIQLSMSSPVAGYMASTIGASNPWNFYSTFLRDNPYVFPLGTEKSIVTLIWSAIAYSIDPWNGGTGSLGVPLYDRTLLVGPNAP